MRNQYDKNDGLISSFGMGFVILWVATILLSLGLTGVIIWAIIKVVLHFTS